MLFSGRTWGRIVIAGISSALAFVGLKVLPPGAGVFQMGLSFAGLALLANLAITSSFTED